MQSWDLATLDVQPHQPEVLGSDDEGRMIAIELPAGETLQEHQVHERAWLVVVRGKVVNGSIHRSGDELRFRIRDRDGTKSVPVTYTGTVPDPFRDGREVIVQGRLRQGTFVGERDSLVTKCPSKFTKDDNSS